MKIQDKFGDRLTNSFLLLDGAVGAELRQRGVDLHGLPDAWDAHDDYWSGRALITDPAAVRRLHEDYLRAGADGITTNTFRTNPSAVAKMDCHVSFQELTQRAVQLARAARDAVKPDALVLGSVGPVDSIHAVGDAQAHHQLDYDALTQELVAAGVDVILFETMNSLHETRIAARAANEARAEFIASFKLRADGKLCSGEELGTAVQALVPYGPSAVLVNCVAPELISSSLWVILQATAGSGIRFGAQAHLEVPTPESGWIHPGNCSISRYVDYVEQWLETGATVIGGCCGTNPDYIEAVQRFRTRISLSKAA
jgi:S-methylmethionine-dependent homocysteine/selenocysteine methylase